MREVILYGPMRAKFGRSFMLDVRSPAEAIRALCAVVKGFRAWFTERARAGQHYHIFVGKKNVAENEVGMYSGKEEPIRIAPTVRGAGNNKVLGAILVIAGAVLMYFTGNPYVFQIGLAMVIGGAAMMLVKVPKTPDVNASAKDKADNVFDGPVNVLAAGNCVPLLYGTMEIGSVVASAGVFTDDISPLISSGGGGGGGGGGGSWPDIPDFDPDQPPSYWDK